MAKLEKLQEFEDVKERYYALKESTFQKLAEDYIKVLEVRVEELKKWILKLPIMP